jgi:catechol 2,3-dioxygenase-like lactoylglutathione lyase family enzyme
MNSLFPVICTKRVAESRDFYAELLGMTIVFDAGWYAQLQGKDAPRAQLGLVELPHVTVPEDWNRPAQGVLVTVEVDDVDTVHARARAAGLRIALPLRDEAFGQRHFMTVDPNGLLVDVVKWITPSEEYARFYVEGA